MKLPLRVLEFRSTRPFSSSNHHVRYERSSRAVVGRPSLTHCGHWAKENTAGIWDHSNDDESLAELTLPNRSSARLGQLRRNPSRQEPRNARIRRHQARADPHAHAAVGLRVPVLQVARQASWYSARAVLRADQHAQRARHGTPGPIVGRSLRLVLTPLHRQNSADDRRAIVGPDRIRALEESHLPRVSSPCRERYRSNGNASF